MNISKTLKNKISKKIGNAISFYRIKQDMTQEELAEKVGADRTYIGALEQGAKCGSVCCLYLISKALNIDFKDMFDFDV